MMILDQIALESRDSIQEQAFADAYQEIWESGYEKGLMGIPLAAGESNCDFLDGYVNGLKQRVFNLRFPQFPVDEFCGF